MSHLFFSFTQSLTQQGKGFCCCLANKQPWQHSSAKDIITCDVSLFSRVARGKAGEKNHIWGQERSIHYLGSRNLNCFKGWGHRCQTSRITGPLVVLLWSAVISQIKHIFQIQTFQKFFTLSTQFSCYHKHSCTHTHPLPSCLQWCGRAGLIWLNCHIMFVPFSQVCLEEMMY